MVSRKVMVVGGVAAVLLVGGIVAASQVNARTTGQTGGTPPPVIPPVTPPTTPTAPTVSVPTSRSDAIQVINQYINSALATSSTGATITGRETQPVYITTLTGAAYLAIVGAMEAGALPVGSGVSPPVNQPAPPVVFPQIFVTYTYTVSGAPPGVASPSYTGTGGPFITQAAALAAANNQAQAQANAVGATSYTLVSVNYTGS